MKAQVTKIIDGVSKHGGTYQMITFKDLDGGRSSRTFIYSDCRNKARWQPVLRHGPGCVISNFVMKKEGIIDADSQFVVMSSALPNSVG